MSFGEAGSGNTGPKAPVGKPTSTVVNKIGKEKEAEEKALPPNPIFEKIRATLQRTEPEKWRRSGEDFNRDLKNPKAIEVWETVFLLAVNDGNLVLRASTPIKPEYFGGGYTLTPTDDPRYTVELREKGWNPRELTDPFYTNSQKKHLKMQKLLEGRMARVLYDEVKSIVESFNTDKRATFEKLCFQLMATLLERIPEMPFDTWKKDETDAHIARYYATIDNMSVEVARVSHNDRTSFHLKMGADGMYKSINTSQVDDIFQAIEDLGRDANLSHLSKLLDSIDL